MDKIQIKSLANSCLNKTCRQINRYNIELKETYNDAVAQSDLKLTHFSLNFDYNKFTFYGEVTYDFSINQLSECMYGSLDKKACYKEEIKNKKENSILLLIAIKK